MRYPVIDLHCDLLSYLQEAPEANPERNEGIGSNFPTLEAGNVKLQVMAIYTSTQKGSSELALNQSKLFQQLSLNYSNRAESCNTQSDLMKIPGSSKLAMLAAIENASGFCEENEALSVGFKRLETIIENCGKLFYIGLTHHGENRFGGGNTTKVGLKKDGKSLLDYLNGKRIALDLSHASDPLAYEMLDYISQFNLKIPVVASHSNFRTVFNHPRNLPTDIAKEIISRKGLIGINFLRAFLNDKDSLALYDHIRFALEIGGKDVLCFGADYFYTYSHPDQSRIPFFYPGQDTSACYPALLENMQSFLLPQIIEKISYRNALSFLNRLWT